MGDTEVFLLSQSSSFSVRFPIVLSHACPLNPFLNNKDTVQPWGKVRGDGITRVPTRLLWTSRLKAWAS